MIYHYTVDISDIPLSPENVLHEMGYGAVEPKAELAAVVATMLEEVKRIASPSCSFSVEKGQVCDEKAVLDNGTEFNVGPILSSLLKGSECFALFTATAGDAFHRYQKGFNPHDDILRCFVADVIGTLLVEATGDRMERLLERNIGPLKHTNRFSPGYCGWSLTEQTTLFSLLGGAPCGIHLSDVCLMTPEKSISGLVGIGSAVNEKAYGCRYCELKTCYKRKRIK